MLGAALRARATPWACTRRRRPAANAPRPAPGRSRWTCRASWKRSELAACRTTLSGLVQRLAATGAWQPGQPWSTAGCHGTGVLEPVGGRWHRARRASRHDLHGGSASTCSALRTAALRVTAAAPGAGPSPRPSWRRWEPSRWWSRRRAPPAHHVALADGSNHVMTVLQSHAACSGDRVEHPDRGAGPLVRHGGQRPAPPGERPHGSRGPR
ncbi:hypothetical protein QJS66_10010 [Kocuria rhizophila]|nr:hypothetical protein QJS66_10010 [Kocuria rhizophila]